MIPHAVIASGAKQSPSGACSAGDCHGALWDNPLGRVAAEPSGDNPSDRSAIGPKGLARIASERVVREASGRAVRNDPADDFALSLRAQRSNLLQSCTEWEIASSRFALLAMTGVTLP